MDLDNEIHFEAVERRSPPVGVWVTDGLRVLSLYLSIWIADKFIATFMRQAFGPVKWPLGTDTSLDALVLNFLVGLALAMHLPLAVRSTPLEVRLPPTLGGVPGGRGRRPGPLLFV